MADKNTDTHNPNAQGDADTGGQAGDNAGQTSGANTDTGDDGKIVFDSQDDLNAFVTKRLRRDRKARAGADADKAVDKAQTDDKAAGADKAGNTGAADNGNAQVVKAQTLMVNAQATLAATAAGLSPDRVKAAVKLADLDLVDVIDDNGDVDEAAVTAAVNEAVKVYPFLKADTSAEAQAQAINNTVQGDTRPAGQVGGSTVKADGDKPVGSVSAEEFSKMGYRERVALRQRDPQQYDRLSGLNT